MPLIPGISMSRKSISLSPLSARRDSPSEKQTISGHFTDIFSKNTFIYPSSCSITKISSSQISIRITLTSPYFFQYTSKSWGNAKELHEKTFFCLFWEKHAQKKIKNVVSYQNHCNYGR